MIYLLFFIKKKKSILPSDTGNYKRKEVPIMFFGYLFGTGIYIYFVILHVTISWWREESVFIPGIQSPGGVDLKQK